MNSEKLGLVLEGGGVKGAFEAGALKALYDKGIKFDAVAGTSIGAVNGAYLAQGGIDMLVDMWVALQPEKLYELTPRLKSMLADKNIRVLELFKEIKKSFGSIRVFFKRSAVKARANFRLEFDEEAIRNSAMDFGLVVFNVSNMSPGELMKDEIKDGELVDYIMASATYPVFPPYIIDGNKYIDGGVYDNMPVNLLARHGYDKLLCIRTNTDDKRPKRKQERDNLLKYVLSPKEDLGHGMLFSNDKQLRYIELGYAAATEALDGELGKFLETRG